jgi:anti-sigma regulatory factor (Ser/Thr protein kinase)
MATVEVSFTPLPAHVRTARLVATAVARRSGVDESLLDEVRLAVGEACSRAVEAHQKHCPGQPIRVALTDDGERFEVVVTDAVPAEVVQADVAATQAAPADREQTGETPAPAGGPGGPAHGESRPGEPSGHGGSRRGGSGESGLAVVAPAGGNGSAGAAPVAGANGDKNGLILQLPAGVGLAVISGLADDFYVLPGGEGTSVAMSWKRRSETA